MSAKLIEGKLISKQIRAELKIEVEKLATQNRVPGLGVILVGDDPASATYVRSKQKACDKLGIYSKNLHLPATTSQAELLQYIEDWNHDDAIHGILVQMPLPSQIDSEAIIHAIRPDKDVDGFHPVNVGKFLIGDETGFLPCTPAGILKLLEYSQIDPKGQHVVVVGRSNIVGKPVAALLIQKKVGANATVTICHSATRDLAHHTHQADILIAATGRAEMIRGDMIKPGAVVIDVGVNRVEDATREKGYRVVGDVDFEAAQTIAAAITPVPGGVGPMTITMLMYNTVQSAKRFFQ